ncbi:hypothetical protein VM1G_06315 [Cytospora mali]|uniref:HNH nuclease domain-containing protein n=1 Tax=Cytospora mali TaxID=578113 RepID=A0A194W312_CYTMA|nr:hypothetical protein VM1G_06315 [Valsa mali]
MAPMKRSALSFSRDTSSSPTRMSDMDALVPDAIIDSKTARSIISDFWPAVITRHRACVFSGQGRALSMSKPIGPGIEAAHIIPQIHWPTCPLEGGGIANRENVGELLSAWTNTCRPENGLAMKSDIHSCWDDRIIAIHPETFIIRCFVHYDVINQYHGLKAKLDVDAGVDRKALWHHYDMEIRPGGSSNKPRTRQASDVPASDAPASYQASGATTHPPSPPPNETDSEGRVVWKVTTEEPARGDPEEAQRQMEKGWRVEEIHEYGRGRPLEQRRCVATEQDEDDTYEQRDSVRGTKRKRHEFSPNSTLARQVGGRERDD